MDHSYCAAMRYRCTATPDTKKCPAQTLDMRVQTGLVIGISFRNHSICSFGSSPSLRGPNVAWTLWRFSRKMPSSSGLRCMINRA